MKRFSPVTLIAAGLVALSCALVLMGDMFFGYLPDRQAEMALIRKRVVDNIAVSAADMLSSGRLAKLPAQLDEFVQINPDLRSIGVRRADSTLLTSTRGHAALWGDPQRLPDSPAHIVVPLHTSNGDWGRIELRFSDPQHGVAAVLDTHPGLLLILVLAVCGSFTFWLYMRRVLQQFDPASVIPERVRIAFDAMTEGVVVLDRKGRIALANQHFRDLCQFTVEPGSSAQDDPMLSRRLSGIDWIAAALPGDSSAHPWHASMRDQRASTGTLIEPTATDHLPSRLIVNCAPIIDGRQQVRGCMVTFDDVSALHKANQRLELALLELQRSRKQIEQKNDELERLANTDSLTGCLNRRAFSRLSEQAFGLCQVQRRPMSAMMIDIDHFKSVNDRFGHAVGDRVIQSVAKVMCAGVRETDYVGRYGGEEFCVAMPDAGESSAVTTGQRIRETIENQIGAELADIAGLKVTVSVGVATLGRRHRSLQDMIQAADAALYEAKAGGRNRVRVAPSVDEDVEQTN